MPYLDLDDALAVIRRSYPKTSGKVQDTHPANRLSQSQRDQLLEACKDGTWIGSRDQLTIRILFLGLRAAEALSLNWENLTHDGYLRWTGKGRKPRHVKCTPTLLALLARWQRQYERSIGRPIRPSDPILCAQVVTRWDHRKGINWGHRLGYTALQTLVTARADAANLGHFAPHDARRSVAKILHDLTTNDGAHIFDVYDIQQQLGHARTDTTVTYISDADTNATDRAATALD